MVISCVFGAWWEMGQEVGTEWLKGTAAKGGVVVPKERKL